MAVGDIYQLRFEANYQAQLNVNIFHYRTIQDGDGLSSAANLGSLFNTNVVPKMTAALSTSWAALGYSVVNLANPSDFDEATIIPPAAGVRTGQGLSPIVCASFRYKRLFPGQRSGWKRMSGLSESDINVVTPEALYTGLLDDLALAFQNDQSDITHVYEPVVVSRPIVLGINPIKWFRPAEVAFAGIGSQVSRKRPFGT